MRPLVCALTHKEVIESVIESGASMRLNVPQAGALTLSACTTFGVVFTC